MHLKLGDKSQRHFGDLQQVGYSPALVDCACWMFVNERLCTQQLCDLSKDPEHVFKKRLQHSDKKATSQPQRYKTAGSPLLSFCCLELTFEFGLVSRSHLLLERRRMAELRLMMWLMVSLFASANSGFNLWVPLSRYLMNWSCKNKTQRTRAFKTGIVVSTLKQHYVGFLPKKNIVYSFTFLVFYISLTCYWINGKPVIYTAPPAGQLIT